MGKYLKEEKVNSLDELMEQDFVILHNQVINKGWFQNWPLHLASSYVRHGEIYVASNVEEEK